MNMRKGLVSVLSAGAIALSCCGTDDGGKKGGGGTSSDKVTCYEANLNQDSGLVYTWHADGSYGSNHVFVHEVEECDDGYCFLNGNKVQNYVKEKGEAIPNSVWKAARSFVGDGNDPREFTEEDPFIVGYLPRIPKSVWGWESDHAEYDWSCEESQCDDPEGYHYNINNACGETNGLENCLGLNQLDRTYTLNTLREDKDYLIRLLFGAAVNGENAIGFCNQKTFKYEK